MFKNFKTRDQIKALENPMVFDVRFKLDDPQYGRKSYEESHYQGAAYLDLNEDLSSEVKDHGGRHPLPKKEDLEKTLRSYGLDENQPVVIYDDGDNVAAGRLWWLLKYYSLSEVYVLHGGFKTLREEDLSNGKEDFNKGNITLVENEKMIATYDDIKVIVDGEKSDTIQLVDSRDEERYLGEYEPIDIKKGHIPGAINLPYKRHFTLEGSVKPTETLKENISSLNTTKETIFYCGSGVTACSNIMIYDELGLPSKLYPGSFSDYISYSENQVVTK